MKEKKQSIDGPDPAAPPQTFNLEVNILRMFAFCHNNRAALEALLKSELDMFGYLGLCHGEESEIDGPYDGNTPFVLLMLNRDDDAFQYCKYWSSKLSCGEMGEAGWIVQKLIAKEPIYPDEEDSRHRNIFEDLPEAANEMQLRYLLTVCIIKMRLVAKYEDALSHGLPVDEVLSEQRLQMEKLMDQIDAQYPETVSVLAQQAPYVPDEVPSPGSLGEYYVIVKLCILRVPGQSSGIMIARRTPIRGTKRRTQTRQGSIAHYLLRLHKRT
jgi:hypothetical protein